MLLGQLQHYLVKYYADQECTLLYIRHQRPGQFNAGSQVIIGKVITLAGTIFNSCVYWLNEYFNHKYGVNLQIMCGYTGLFGFCIFMVYQFSVTIPNWTKLVTDPILEHNVVFWQWGILVKLLYGALILVQCVWSVFIKNILISELLQILII
ncbi:Conserved_hypothetical protein [Hexamita inflata]|uniref:Uncharacterized protein n=1 Tax=Hexamita inflata TaxID=28002 RepID=A0ABP1IL09_9EUKA